MAIDRTSKFAFAQQLEKATRMVAAGFLRALVEAVPYKVHTVPTDNGVQFAHTLADAAPSGGEGGEAAETSWAAPQEARTGRVQTFGYAREDHGIEHRSTRPY